MSQNIGGFTTSGIVTLNKSTGTATLTGDVSTNNLTLTSGKLILGANDLIVNGSITGGSASSYVVTDGTGGYLYQNVASSNVLYPVGTSSSYTPLTLNNYGGNNDNYGVYVSALTASPSLRASQASFHFLLQSEPPIRV